MKRYRAMALLLVLLAATGCGWGKASSSGNQEEGSASPAVASQTESAPDLEEVADPTTLSLGELEAGLRRYVNEGDESADEKLAGLLQRWGLQPVGDRLTLAKADLDGDGDTELITVLTVAREDITGQGALFVLYRSDGEWQLDRSAQVPGPALHAVADLTGDGLPEVIWSSTETGAHTAFTTVFVSTWVRGMLEDLPGEMPMAGMELELDGRDLLLTGGLINSAGAGQAQRSRTDRYRFDGQRFALVDRQYEASSYGYHRLIDGIVAEQFGRTEDALQALREAVEADRSALAGGMVPTQWQDRFAAAVQTYARVRLALLLGNADPEARQVLQEATGPYAGLAAAMLGAGDTEEACQAAVDWAKANPEFLEALNSPYGYAHPVWLSSDLCGPLPPNGA